MILMIESRVLPLPSWQWKAAQHANTAFVSFLTGLWLTRRSQGRELTASLTFIVAQLTLATTIHLLRPEFGFNRAGLAETLAALLVIVVWARRRRAVIL
jgi:hypothetical protein